MMDIFKRGKKLEGSSCSINPTVFSNEVQYLTSSILGKNPQSWIVLYLCSK